MQFRLAFAFVTSTYLVTACGKSSDPPAAFKDFDRCTAGDESACSRDCDDGDDPACNTLLGLYLRADRDVEAAALTKRLCEVGRKYFCPSYAMALSEGHGIERDRARARELFVHTCNYDPKACSEFGNLYAIGNGVARDLELGTLLLELACRHHDAPACQDLQRLHATPP